MQAIKVAHIENFYPVLKELVQCEDVFNFYNKSDEDMSFIYNTFAAYRRDMKTYNSSKWIKYVKPDELEIVDEDTENWGRSYKVLIKCENQRKYMVLIFDFVEDEKCCIKEWIEDDEDNILLFKPGFIMHHIKDEYKNIDYSSDSDESVDFEDEATECPICFAEFSKIDLEVCKPCGHCVCEECYNHIKHCPLCRKEIKKENEKNRGPEIDIDYISECIDTYNYEELLNIIDIDSFVEDVINQDGIRHTLHYDYEECFDDLRVIVVERQEGRLNELNEKHI
jgi:hypothetical protein